MGALSRLVGVWGAVAAAVLVRVVWIFLFPGKWWNNDSYFYFEQAERMASGGWVNFFPNGFPLLIFVVEWLCGGVREAAVGVLLGVNVCLAAGSVWCVWGICGRLGGGVLAARVAAWAVALWPHQVNYAGQLMTEVPATFFLLLGFWLMLCGRGVGAGGCVAVMIFLRTTLAPVALLWVVWLLWSGRGWRCAVCVLAGVVLGFALEWGGAAAAGGGEGKGNLGINFWIAERTVGGRIEVPPEAVAGEVSTAEGWERYWAGAVGDTGRFVRQRVLALWELWGPWPYRGGWESPVTGDFYGRSVAENVVLGLRFPALLLALWMVWRLRREGDVWAALVPVVLITAVHVVFYGLPRYIFPAEPFVFLLAALVLRGGGCCHAGVSRNEKGGVGKLAEM